MRYVGGGCCSDTTHIINRGERQYSATIAEKLGEMKGSLSSLAFTRRLRNFVVICPNELLKQEDTAATAAMLHRYWADDHVHKAAEGYQVLSRRLIEKMMDADLKRPILSSGGGTAAPIDWTTRRSNWVTSNDSVVHRRDTMPNPRGGGGGGGNDRGHGGWRGRGRGYKRGPGYRPKPY
jgi:hypothetical protein